MEIGESHDYLSYSNRNKSKLIRTFTTISKNLSLSVSSVILNEHYVHSYNIYVYVQQYELSHFQHVYNSLALKFKWQMSEKSIMRHPLLMKNIIIIQIIIVASHFTS